MGQLEVIFNNVDEIVKGYKSQSPFGMENEFPKFLPLMISFSGEREG